MNYSCTQCGKSCGLFHEIAIDPRSQARVRALDFRPLMREDTRDRDPIVPSPMDDKRQMLLQVDGHCVFQNDGGLCSIHAAHGEPVKPQTCRDFPFRYVETPRGAYVGLSFACTAVQANTGTPVREQRGDLEASREISNARLESAETPQLTTRHEISWDACLALEDDLRLILDRRDRPFGLRLVAQSVYLDLFEAFLREIRGDRPLANSPAARRPGQFAPDTATEDIAVLHALRNKYLATESGEPLFRLARKIRGNASLQRAFIGLITAFRQNLYVKGKSPGRVGTALSLSRHYLAHAGKIGRVHLEALEKRFDYAEFTRIGFNESDEGNEELLHRYFSHVLFRKDHLLSPNVWLGHRLMLMQYALLRWHATGIAALTAQDAVTNAVLREAVGVVDRHYVFHTPFGKLFEDIPMLGMILDGIVRKPIFAASMTISPVSGKDRKRE